MNEDTASQLLESIEQMAPGVTLESAAQTVMAEALKACSSLEQLTQLPVTPKTLDRLKDGGFLPDQEWTRLKDLLDPQQPC
ncbi:hypothetical protein [Parasynechococcus sp.]|jgi:hypothetical protein|uniref:hypothetical protein n=1 Tax=Parasynechococcus sp. TaxID=3101203 RepID=UPI003703FF29